MKNANIPNSLNSLSSDYDDYASNCSSSMRRAMLPIRELDFESRIMFNAKLPKKKPIADQLRKNDFVVDLNYYKNLSQTNNNQQLIKTLKHCFNQEDENSENMSNNNILDLDRSDLALENKVLNSSYTSIGNKFENSNNTFTPKSSPLTKKNLRHHHQDKRLSVDSNLKKLNLKMDNNKNFESMMMTTLLDDANKISNTLTKSSPNVKIPSGKKTVKYNYSNLDFNKYTNEQIDNLKNQLDPNMNTERDKTELGVNLIQNETNDPCESLLGTQRRKTTKTTTFEESNLPRPRLMNKNMNTNRSRNYKYRIWQCKIYNYLERPRGWKSGIYHIIIFATVFLCLILSVLATIPTYEVTASNILMQTEMIIVVWLSVELSLRVWSAGCRSRYQTWKGRLKFMKNAFCILDLTVIVASITLTVIASSQNKHKNFAAAAFRGLRFFQILRMLRVDRRAGTWRLLGTVVWAHRQELITTFYIGFLSLISSSFIMYLLEKDAAGTKISTFADSLWWGVITLCTIGYGDVYPVTWTGKLLASSVALIGISFFALPAGILGSGFALKVQAMQRQKHLNRRRAPAARLIQCLWRCYAADPNSMSTATWKMHTKAIANQHQSILPSLSQPPNIPEYSIANLAKPYISNNSFLNRVTSLKRRTPPLSATGEQKQLNENKSYVKTNSLIQLPYSTGTNVEMLHTRRDAIVIPGLFNSQTSVYTYNAPNSQVSSPSPETLLQESDSPTNEFTHVGNRPNNPYVVALQQVSSRSQQYAQNDHSKVAPVKSSFAHRTLNFLSELNSSNGKSENDELLGNEGNHTSGNTNHHHHHSNKPQLTLQQKNAIRAVRKIAYFVARRKFKEALRPYDVTDVIEQYSAGNLDMLARIKTLQFRLDKILGSTKAKDCYDSCSISLASRIVKVERQIDDIGLKFDKFITAYSIDMKVLLDKSNKSLVQKDRLFHRNNLIFENNLPLKFEERKQTSLDKRAKTILAKSNLLNKNPSQYDKLAQRRLSLNKKLSSLSIDEEGTTDENEINEEKIKLEKLREQQELINKQIIEVMTNLNNKCKNEVEDPYEYNDEDYYYDDFNYDNDEIEIGSPSCDLNKLKKIRPHKTTLKHENKRIAENIDKLYKLSKSEFSIKYSAKRNKNLKALMKKYLLNAINRDSLLTNQVKIRRFKSDSSLYQEPFKQPKKLSSLNHLKYTGLKMLDKSFKLDCNRKKRVQISQNFHLIQMNENECLITNEEKDTVNCLVYNENESKK